MRDFCVKGDAISPSLQGLGNGGKTKPTSLLHYLVLGVIEIEGKAAESAKSF